MRGKHTHLSVSTSNVVTGKQKTPPDNEHHLVFYNESQYTK